MNGIVRWDPFRELEDVHNRLADFFDRAPMRRDGKRESIATAEWAPVTTSPKP
jgi:hypothetical protein